MRRVGVIACCLAFSPLVFAEVTFPDLPPHAQVDEALGSHLQVQLATSDIKIEQVNQRKWSAGPYEFNVRAGSSQRKFAATGKTLSEWDVAIERPVRLPNKMFIDGDIGAEGVSRAEHALGDAYHEAGRNLLHLWFNWQREQAQIAQWQQQEENLKLQAAMTEKRFKAGDAPKMELGQAQAALAQASVSLHQAQMRTRLASAELLRLFPAITLPEKEILATPQAIDHDLAYWKKLILEHNHELRLVETESRIQSMLAQRSRADRLPDPTIGLRYSNDMGGDETVTGVYISVPLSFGLRGANAEHQQYLAESSRNRESAIRRRLEGDTFSAYTQAVNTYHAWQHAQEAAESLRKNAALVARAYALGESSLADTLAARRLALETTLVESISLLDANEARYRLLLDAHELWGLPNEDDHAEKNH